MREMFDGVHRSGTEKAQIFINTGAYAPKGGDRMLETIEEKNTYTVEEFAKKVNKHPATIYNWVEKGWIPVDTTSGIRIPKPEMDLVREISVLTNRKYNVVWECMKEYICSLEDSFEDVLEQKGRGRVIREIKRIVERKG